MRDFVQSQVEDRGLRAGECDGFKPPDHHRDRHPCIEVFRGLKPEHDTAYPAIALAMAEDWAKRPFMDGH